MIARQLLAAGTCASIMLVSGASITRVEGQTLPVKFATSQLRIEGELPALAGAIEWINSPPLTPPALRGKVVLIDTADRENRELFSGTYLVEAPTEAPPKEWLSLAAIGHQSTPVRSRRQFQPWLKPGPRSQSYQHV